MFFFLPTVALLSLLASLWRNETGTHSPIGHVLRACLSPTRLKMLLVLQLLVLRRTLRTRMLMASLMVRLLALRKMKKETTTRRILSDLGTSSMLFSLFGVLMPKGER